MLGKLWEQLEHHISTGYVISEATYSSTVDKLFYGIGQGSCSSPILWALLNQLIMTELGEKFDYIKLVSVDNIITNTRPGNSSVDDTTTGVTSDDTARDPVSIDVTDITANEAELINQMSSTYFRLQVATSRQRNTCGTLLHIGGRKAYLDYLQKERIIEG
jgi:hypothetical protein